MPTRLDKPAGSFVGGSFVVHVNDINIGVVNLRTEDDERDVGLGDVMPQLGIGEVNGHHDDAIDTTPQHDFAEVSLVFVDVVAIGDDDLVTMLAGDFLDCANDGVVEAVAEVGDHDGNRLGALGAEATGDGVGTIAELFDRKQDALNGFFADLGGGFSSVEDARNRWLRDTSEFGDIVHGGLSAFRNRLFRCHVKTFLRGCDARFNKVSDLCRAGDRYRIIHLSRANGRVQMDIYYWLVPV